MLGGILARLAAVALLLLIACGGSEGERVPEEVDGPQRSEIGRFGLTPYPYLTEAPPLQATELDGTYERELTVAEAGGEPVACRRCAPYRLDAGVATLILDRGRYFVLYEALETDVCPECKPPPPFRAAGHFFLHGDEITLVNDPNCTGMQGIYRWSMAEGGLTLEVVEDACPFAQLRQKFLMEEPWVPR